MKFKIEANEKEVERMLKKKEGSLYNRLNEKEKKYLLYSFWLFISILLIVLVIYGMFYFIKELDTDYITKYECKQLINDKISEIRYLDKWDRLFNGIEPFLGGLVFAVVLGWIIHGVGFKIIGR